MNKICTVNLSNKEISYSDYDVTLEKSQGRSLAINIIESNTNDNTDRLDEDNVIVLSPGLFTGSVAPSTGRITVAAKRGKGLDIQICNMTGSMPQKLASLNYSALVIKGKAKCNNTVLYIDKDNVKLIEMEKLNNAIVPQIISTIKNEYGDNCSIMGTGPAADKLMPLATLFSTYPNGIPEYYCSRNAFGDIWGSKGLKAIVINSNRFFDATCFDKENFSRESKKLAKIIINNPICGQALPGHGSITLIRMLKNKESVRFDKPKEVIKANMSISTGTSDNTVAINKSKAKLNKTCAPLCVIGCLNRHCSSATEMFSTPAESEVNAALSNCFNINDTHFAKKMNTRAFELCIDSTEFVFTSNLYFKALGITPTKDEIYNLLGEIESNTVIGRIIASKTAGVYELFKDNTALKPLVTKPVINEEGSFKVIMKNYFDDFKDLSDMELLYHQIFILANLGFCIFTSFA